MACSKGFIDKSHLVDKTIPMILISINKILLTLFFFRKRKLRRLRGSAFLLYMDIISPSSNVSVTSNENCSCYQINLKECALLQFKLTPKAKTGVSYLNSTPLFSNSQQNHILEFGPLFLVLLFQSFRRGPCFPRRITYPTGTSLSNLALPR